MILTKLSKIGLNFSWRVLCNRFVVTFVVTLLLFSFGQPDRPVALPYIAYFAAFPLFFALIFQCSSRLKRFLVAALWIFGYNLIQLSWLATTHYHGQGIVIAYLLLSFAFAFQLALIFLLLPTKKPHRSPSLPFACSPLDDH